MGNKQVIPQLTPEQIKTAQCATKKNEFSDWTKRATDAQRIAREKQIAADTCSPAEAAARKAVATGPSQCQVNDVKLRESQRDIRTLTTEWETCNKDEVLRRKLEAARKEAVEWEIGARGRMYDAEKDFETKTIAIDKISVSAKELYQTLFEKEKELAQLQSRRDNTEQLERRERRAFLDNEPQAGTGGVPGIRTEDDRTVFPFFLIFSFFAGTLICLILFVTVRHWVFGHKLIAVVFGTPVALAITYYIIAYYG
jgi:predicted RND superfamily exporter protein